MLSAALFPNGVVARVFEAAALSSISLVVCDYSLSELAMVIRRKFPNRVDQASLFVARLVSAVDLVTAPSRPLPGVAEHLVRDPKDWPIIRSAVAAGAEFIITGDKDLLGSGLGFPRSITVRELLTLIQSARDV